MSSRLSHFFGRRSRPESSGTSNPASDDYLDYIPYKPPDSLDLHSPSLNATRSGPVRIRNATVPPVSSNGFDIGQSPQPIVHSSTQSHRVPLSSLLSSFASKSRPLSRSTSARPSPSISRSNSIQSNSSGSRVIRHKPSHSSDFVPSHTFKAHDYPHSQDNHATVHSQASPPHRRPFFHTQVTPSSEPFPSDTHQNIQLVNTDPRPDISHPRPHPYTSPLSLQGSFSAPRTAPLPPTHSFIPSLPYSHTDEGLPAVSPKDRGLLRATQGFKKLKSSISTPNLRSNSTANKPDKGTSQGGASHKWISAETWCDSFLLPRPRLKGRRNISISPPLSSTDQANPPFESRVLAHSRSLVNIRTGEPARRPPSPDPVSPPSSGRPPRPKSFALDDLALPSPEPSLASVLRQGEQLLHQRRKWNMAASRSLGNKQARVLSRSRSKSLNTKDKEGKEGALSYLAARSLLGNQDPVPIHPQPPQKLVKRHRGLSEPRTSSDRRPSTSTAAKTTIDTHSRNSSWAKTALKACIDSDVSPGEERRHAFEKALADGETRHFVSVDPASDPFGLSPTSPLSLRGPPTQRVAFVDNNPSRPPIGAQEITPEPSKSSGSPDPSDRYMGIAMSTPPAMVIEDDLSEYPLSHPYASAGGLYPSTARFAHKKSESTGSEYAGAHPILTQQGQTLYSSLRPAPTYQARFSGHPYALTTSARDSYLSESKVIPLPRQDSDIPLPEKMWVTLNPLANTANEVLPEEILAYSPYGVPHDSPLLHSEASPREAIDNIFEPTDPILPPRNKSTPTSPLAEMAHSSLEEQEHTFDRGTQEWTKPIPTAGALNGQQPGNSHSLSSHTDSNHNQVVLEHRLVSAHRLIPSGPASRLSSGTTNSGQNSVASRSSKAPSSSRSRHDHPFVSSPTHSSRPSSSSVASASSIVSPPRAEPLGHVMEGIPEISSPLDPMGGGPSRLHVSGKTGASPSHAASSSASVTSSGSSPPRPLGSVDDLGEFEDLFYHPKAWQAQQSEAVGEVESNTFPAEILHRPGFRPLPIVHEVQSSTSSDGNDDESHRHGLRPYRAQATEFIISPVDEAREEEDAEDHTFGFNKVARSQESGTSLSHGILEQPLVPFHSTSTLPEDVELDSSRASSPEDHTMFYRLGQVASVTTPPPNTVSHRPTSSVGEMSYALPERYRFSNEIGSPINPYRSGLASSHTESILISPYRASAAPGSSSSPPATATAHLHPPSATLRSSLDEATHRRSYMTTSDASRMSGLSDFPVPPLHIPADPLGRLLGERPSVIVDSYFDRSSIDTKEHGDVDDEQLLPPRPPRPPSANTATSDERRMTFGPGSLLNSESE